MNYFLAATGLVLLFLGGDIYVRSLVRLADAFRISTRISGIVIGGMGTSMPELLVCAMAAWHGHTDLVVGNVIGSNVANVLLILGIAGVLSTVTFSRKLLGFDAKYMVAVTLVFIACAATGTLVFWMALLFVAILLWYYFLVYRREQQVNTPEVSQHEARGKQFVVGALFFVVGLCLLIVGSDIFVKYSVIIATHLGVSETVIGLTLVAIGTSLPEVATCIMAAIKKHADIVVGNVIGSNIFNILGVLGVTLFLSPMHVVMKNLLINGAVMLLATLGFAALILANKRINKSLAVAMLILYVFYVLILAPLAQ